MATSLHKKMAPKARKALTPASIFLRIRPTATSGSGHTEGAAVQKKLDSWTASQVTMQDDDRREKTKYNYTAVVPPEYDNEAAFGQMAPELIIAWHNDLCNVLFFTYGQTGSGKTHTMLGVVDSLSSPVPVPGWGNFPRVVHSTLEKMTEWRKQGVQCTLRVSAIEFYCSAGWDINSEIKAPVKIDVNARIFGAQLTELTSTEGLAEFISYVYGNRTTAKTLMNNASSRSHCTLVLTLHQLSADGKYHSTFFSIVDMAGSERSSKTGGVRMTGMEAGIEAWKMFEAGTPEKLSIGAQGMMINNELTFLATEILKAADMHTKGLPFRAQKEMSTAATFYFSACCDGRARLGVCLCISQSPQHGYKSWFTLRYAEQLCKCSAPLVRVKPVDFDKALKDAQKAADEAAARFAPRAGAPPTGPKAYRVWALQAGQAGHTAEQLAVLQQLGAERAGAGLILPPAKAASAKPLPANQDEVELVDINGEVLPPPVGDANCNSKASEAEEPTAVER